MKITKHCELIRKEQLFNKDYSSLNVAVNLLTLCQWVWDINLQDPNVTRSIWAWAPPNLSD